MNIPLLIKFAARNFAQKHYNDNTKVLRVYSIALWTKIMVLKNTISGLLAVTLFALSGICPNTSPAHASENPLENCTQQPILITNSSSKWIGILGVRWLNEAAQEWILQPINNEIIRQNGTWLTNITPWGLEGHRTYYQVKFKFLENEDKMGWSETKTTSQVQVPDCRLGTQINVKIVDFR